ncbi:hypothetical protein EBQ91_00785 [bacterium]|nr:hypothetical protein [bacterium]
MFPMSNNMSGSATITKTGCKGRLCNIIIRNTAVSFIAEKTNLYVEYYEYDKITSLGIPLFVGKNIYKDMVSIYDDTYMNFLAYPQYVNVNLNDNFFQTAEISKMIYDYFHSSPVKASIVDKNPFRSRYNTNNDCFVHLRLGDIAHQPFCLGLKYYTKAIEQVGPFDTLYIASDSPDHHLIKSLLEMYPNRSRLVLNDEVRTIQFGSTCRNIVLSHGTFSAVIGWLGFDSKVYYPEYETMWHGDVFSVNPDWHKITNYR